MDKQQITDEAIKYCSHIDFTDDKNLSEKGRFRVKEWAKQDFIAGANYVLRQLRLSGVMCSCNCKCDGCGKMYYEPNIKMDFGEFNICDDCKNNPKIQFE